MYDSHIYWREYKELKDQIVDIVNGEMEEYDIDEQFLLYIITDSPPQIFS